jgi:hypothetical protein
MLQNQANELELRAQELAIQQQKDTHAFEFGKDALAAKITDRRDQRVHEQGMRKQTFRLLLVTIIVVSMLIAYALFSNNAAFATEIIKALVFVFSGGAGGYGLAKAQSAKSARARENDEES